MKNLLLTLSFCFITFMSFSQDAVTIKHTNYTTVYSKSKCYPIMVEWWVTKAKVSCDKPLARKDNFQPDPELPKETNLKKDYVGSGFDRGHMMPAADNLCQTPKVQDECFYFSNMSPQYHSLNAGDWKSLETLVRKFAVENDSIHVWCGNVGEVKKVGMISIPQYCWKVVYIAKTKQMNAYIFENNTSKPNGIEDNLVPVKEVEKLTGLKFR
jgi:endonuclease G